MSGLRAKASTFDHPKAPHATVIAERHFTAALEIVLPVEEASLDAARAADVLCDALRGDDAGGAGDARGVAASDAPDFYAAELSLADILDEGFLAAHVRAPGAKLYAVNADGRADRDDVAAVTPTGRLLLSLTPETYRRAGVSGAPSDDGTLKRRCAVNLANKTFAPGTPFRDRLVACARAMDAEGERRGVGTYLCAHTVDDVPTPMLFPAGRPHAPRAVFATAARLLAYDVADAAAIPLGFVDGTDDARDAAEALEAFFDWLGELTLGRSGEEDADGDARGVDVAGEGAKVGFAATRRWEGLLTPGRVDAALAFCRRTVRDGKAPWTALTTWGFADDPSREGGAGGDGGFPAGNHLTFVVLPVDRYVMFSVPPR